MRRPATRGTGANASELRWGVAAAFVLAVLTVVDLFLPSRVNISGALVVAPFLAASGVAPGGVLLLGAAAVAAGAGLDFLDRNDPHASVASIIVIVIGTALAAQASWLRIKREQRLMDLTIVAEATQRAIIRKPAPRVGSVAVATWYQSAARSASVGGDCYEILDTPFGTRAFVGDVRGHGMPSVRLAALVLGGFRAMAYVDPDLRTIARELDGLVSRYATDPSETDVDGEEFVTAVLCQVDSSTLTIANCGHPPPLLIAPDGHVRALDASVLASPLGVGSDPALDEVETPPSTRVLLYTDGLIEALDRSGKYFDLVRAAMGLAAGPLDAATGRLIDQLNGHADGQLDDDVAIMVLEPLPAIGLGGSGSSSQALTPQRERPAALPPANQAGG
jgi:phosphoserine phosphatase RsbU/P